MDKRLIILMAIFLLCSASIFAYRKFGYKPEGIRYEIRPRGVIQAGESITFIDKTPGASRWKWDFGDGEYSMDQSGNHTYLDPGKYEVTLTAYGPFGSQKESVSVNVVAGNYLSTSQRPAIVGPSEVKKDDPSSWRSSVSAAAYEWRVKGEEDLINSKQSGQSATFSFATPGRKTIVLSLHQPDTILQQIVTVTGGYSAPAPPLKKPKAAIKERPITTPKNEKSLFDDEDRNKE